MPNRTDIPLPCDFNGYCSSRSSRSHPPTDVSNVTSLKMEEGKYVQLVCLRERITVLLKNVSFLKTERKEHLGQ